MQCICSPAGTIMLRICYSDTGAEQRWKLSGQLAGVWVNELRSCWQQTRSVAARPHALLDLSEVTFIDEAGERLLRDIRTAGASFVTAGIANRHLLENLKVNGKKPLRRLIGG